MRLCHRHTFSEQIISQSILNKYLLSFQNCLFYMYRYYSIEPTNHDGQRVQRMPLKYGLSTSFYFMYELFRGRKCVQFVTDQTRISHLHIYIFILLSII